MLVGLYNNPCGLEPRQYKGLEPWLGWINEYYPWIISLDFFNKSRLKTQFVSVTRECEALSQGRGNQAVLGRQLLESECLHFIESRLDVKTNLCV